MYPSCLISLGPTQGLVQCMGGIFLRQYLWGGFNFLPPGWNPWISSRGHSETNKCWIAVFASLLPENYCKIVLDYFCTLPNKSESIDLSLWTNRGLKMPGWLLCWKQISHRFTQGLVHNWEERVFFSLYFKNCWYGEDLIFNFEGEIMIKVGWCVWESTILHFITRFKLLKSPP